MANVFSATHYLKIASALATAEPITLAAKFYCLSTPAGSAVSIHDSSTSDTRALIDRTSPFRMAAVSINQGVVEGQALSATFSTSTWYSGVAVFRSTTSRDVYLDGTKTSNTTSVSPVTPNQTWFGNGPYGGWVGWLASMGVWNVALNDDEINSLVKGFPPNRVRPQSLLACIKAINAAVDMKGNALTISISGYADHPRVYGG